MKNISNLIDFLSDEEIGGDNSYKIIKILSPQESCHLSRKVCIRFTLADKGTNWEHWDRDRVS